MGSKATQKNLTWQKKIVPRCARDNLEGQKSLGLLKISLKMAHKVICPQKKKIISSIFKISGTLIVIKRRVLGLFGLFWDRIEQYFINKNNCQFSICGIALLRILRICESGISPRDCSIAICGLQQKKFFALLCVKVTQSFLKRTTWCYS